MPWKRAANSTVPLRPRAIAITNSSFGESDHSASSKRPFDSRWTFGPRRRIHRPPFPSTARSSTAAPDAETSLSVTSVNVAPSNRTSP